MSRRTFFSFRYKNDNWRAAIVRNSWVTQDRIAAGFFDSVIWESMKKETDTAIESWIDKQLNGTSVTVVLIGSNTYGRKWINYEMVSSNRRKNGMLGIYINKLEDSQGNTSSKGKNPFDYYKFPRNGQTVTYPVYD